MHLMLGCFALYRVHSEKPVPAAEKTDFVALPGSTQPALGLDPRAADAEAQREGHA
jgi:hypothetical protein